MFKYQLGRTPNFLTNRNVDVWYMDGSGTNDRFKAGIYDPNANHEESILIGRLSMVFQAEVYLPSQDVQNS